jgi:hypothetical protein
MQELDKAVALSQEHRMNHLNYTDAVYYTISARLPSFHFLLCVGSFMPRFAIEVPTCMVPLWARVGTTMSHGMVDSLIEGKTPAQRQINQRHEHDPGGISST